MGSNHDQFGQHRYGQFHKRARERFARRMRAGEVFYCWRPTCPTPDQPVDPRSWDLGHVEGAEEVARFGVRHPEHRKCNRATTTHLRQALAEARGEPAAANGVGRKAAVKKARPPRFDGLPDPQPNNSVNTWSRHWFGPFDPRCGRCRELGHACEDAEPEDDAA